MANFSAQNFITQARAKNIPDEAIYSYLQGKGLLNQTNAPDFKATPANNALGPTGSGILPTIGRSITDAGMGFGSVIGKTGLGLGSLATQAVGGIAGAMGAKGVQQGAQNVAGDIQGISNAMYNTPQAQKQMNTISGGIGRGIGTVATLASPEGLEAKAGQAVQDVTDATKMGPLASKLSKVATKAITGGLSFGTIGAAQGTGFKGNAALGVLSGGTSEAISAFGKPLAEALQKSDFKLSPMQEQKAAKKVGDAAKFMTDHAIIGTTSSKLSKLGSITKGFEDALQKSLPKTFAISKKQIASTASRMVDGLVNEDPATYQQARNTVRQGLATLDKSSGTSIQGSINAETALSGKRSWGQIAFKNSKNADARVNSQGAFILETAYQKSLNDAMAQSHSMIQLPKDLEQYFGGRSQVSLDEFNKTYSTAISAKNFTYLSQGKAGTPLIGRLAGLYIGEMLGQSVMPGLGGKIGGMIGGEMAAKYIPSGLRMAGEAGYQAAAGIPGAVKAGYGAATAVTPSSQ